MFIEPNIICTRHVDDRRHLLKFEQIKIKGTLFSRRGDVLTVITNRSPSCQTFCTSCRRQEISPGILVGQIQETSPNVEVTFTLIGGFTFINYNCWNKLILRSVYVKPMTSFRGYEKSLEIEVVNVMRGSTKIKVAEFKETSSHVEVTSITK